MSDTGKYAWLVIGYFPFMPSLVSKHRTREEAEAEKVRLRDAGPHMGESYCVEPYSFWYLYPEAEEDYAPVHSDEAKGISSEAQQGIRGVKEEQTIE